MLNYVTLEDYYLVNSIASSQSPVQFFLSLFATGEMKHSFKHDVLRSTASGTVKKIPSFNGTWNLISSRGGKYLYQ